MDQDEPNSLKIPYPQRTDAFSTEGEYSVSSVSLESISRAMEAKESFQSDLNIHPEGHQMFRGNNYIYGPLKVLNLGLHDYLRPKSTIQDPSFNSGEATLPYGPGPAALGPVHVGQRGL
ncbi:hypothetical protein O181_011016 [Austropuccinia psidii MF-1]|uniref:Uncharacterized protein n=1 Tax=Austropuccinia psidii MF-1 TaxID=1389203 RepID=A0A9Q3BS45_9BASI|nr:hypothetical protein [Austropuccinia psidii MF-1]